MPKAHLNRPSTYPPGVVAAASPETDAPFSASPRSLPVAPAAKALLKDWQEYARAVGVDPAGMTKTQIQKAVR